ncbi:hypothetical protein LMG27177_02421 [Paraburkholderia fynbosensis]|uniref:Uncharacterized protein n=1 Tax=Paraburkholderia fynbosensis TaxID=1200993 RepID=A0A6J5FW60_9BURK|nr:hypothetical protein LMG27177_02421 [Paraburkholderia fynbosensis]
MTRTGTQSAALRADFLRQELQEAAPRATGVEGYLEHEAAVYGTLLESTRAIPWKIDWASMEFAQRHGSPLSPALARLRGVGKMPLCSLTTHHPGPMP